MGLRPFASYEIPSLSNTAVKLSSTSSKVDDWLVRVRPSAYRKVVVGGLLGWSFVYILKRVVARTLSWTYPRG